MTAIGVDVFRRDCGSSRGKIFEHSGAVIGIKHRGSKVDLTCLVLTGCDTVAQNGILLIEMLRKRRDLASWCRALGTIKA